LFHGLPIPGGFDRGVFEREATLLYNMGFAVEWPEAVAMATERLRGGAGAQQVGFLGGSLLQPGAPPSAGMERYRRA
jgi:hypothetical protein